MTRVLMVTGVLLIITVLALCPSHAEDQHWPNFSCHPKKEGHWQRNAFRIHRANWESCKDAYEEHKGRCHYVCMLQSRRTLYRIKGQPLTFDIDAFVTNFVAEELGYNPEKPEAAELSLMNKIRSGLENCKKNHPEYEKLVVKKEPCDRSQNFTQCINQAVGC